MFIIALMALKGGVSKTTLAANIACMAWGDAALREYDRRVCLIDLDFAQGSLTAVHRLRGYAGPDLLTIEEFADLPHLIASAERAGYPVCVIDTAGQDTPALSMVADMANLCIVPVGPSELDFLGVLPTLQMLRRKDANFRVVLARTWHTETAAMTILRERLQPEGLLFATRIAERVAYKEAIRFGQAVTEFDPAYRAGEEMTSFYCEVKGSAGRICGMSDGVKRDRPKAFLDAMRDEPVRDLPPTPPDLIQQTTVRLPVKVEKEIQRVAEVTGVSMNVIILDAVDRLLAHHGRASIVELAPWAVAYFRRDRRKGGA